MRQNVRSANRMKPEQVAELIEKLIDQKISLEALGKSKTVAGEKRQFLVDASKENIAKTKASLVEALKSAL